jgi:hypothetical protein
VAFLAIGGTELYVLHWGGRTEKPPDRHQAGKQYWVGFGGLTLV